MQQIMRNLVRRYVTVEQRKAESQGVTEDDVNEIKQDISAFRFELVEILKGSGMNTSKASGQGAGKFSKSKQTLIQNHLMTISFLSKFKGGKKNRQKERRLMKGFNLAPPTATPGMTSLPPVAEFNNSFDQSSNQPDFYGSTFSGILSSGITPRRNYMYSMQQFSSSQSSFSESFGTLGKLGKLSSRLRNQNSSINNISNQSSQKRRWGIFSFFS